MTALSPQQVIGGVNRRESKTFGWIYEEYQPYVFSMVKKQTGDIADTEDLVADVFESLLKQNGRFNNKSKIRHFLSSTARNICQDYLRHLRVVKAGSDEIARNYPYTDEESWIEAETSASFRQLVTIAIEKLPPKNREVFKLFYNRHMTNEEIAATLAISQKTVGNHKSEAIKILKIEVLKMSGNIISLLYLLLC